MLSSILHKFKKFRQKIFSCFHARSDALIELMDALAGNLTARSVVQLSLNPAFRRQYGSIHDAISNFAVEPTQDADIEQCLIEQCSPTTTTQPFHLIVLDCTAAPRKYANTLNDRGMVYAPTIIPGNKPVTVGHQYSIMGFLPEQAPENENIPWMLPLSTRRVATQTNGIIVGARQLKAAMSHLTKELTVILGDTAYSSPHFIHEVQQHENAVLIARLLIITSISPPIRPTLPGWTNRGDD